MTSLTDKIKKVRDALNGISGIKAYHYEKAAKASAPYIVWAEQAEGRYRFNAENRKQEQTIVGAVDLFTLKEYDSNIDAIQNALDEAEGVGFNLEAVQYEDETKLIHYTWSWEVV